MSCALHALLCDLRYDAPRELFDDRPGHMMRLLDPVAQAGHLVYERLNTAAAGLVRHPDEMPQRVLRFALWKTGFIEVARPPVYFASKRPERLRLYLTPPPLLYQAFDGNLEKLVYHLDRLSDDGARALEQARRRPPMGARALRRLHPWSEPRTLREPGGSRVPSFKVGGRGAEALQERLAGRREERGFWMRHEESRLARRDGDTDRAFPFGTYAMRVYHGAPVEPEPPPGSRIAQPGPTLSAVREQMESARHGAGDSEPVAADVHELTDAVREAVRSSSDEVMQEDDLDFTQAAPVARPTSADLTDRGPAVVRHRFGPQPTPGPSRVITLRDRRRGRPPPTGRTATDPPR